MKKTNKMTANMLAYELGRVISQLVAINYTNRSVMRKIQDDISNGQVDSDEINAELYNLEQLELIANDILQELEGAVVSYENSNRGEDN